MPTQISDKKDILTTQAAQVSQFYTDFASAYDFVKVDAAKNEYYITEDIYISIVKESTKLTFNINKGDNKYTIDNIDGWMSYQFITFSTGEVLFRISLSSNMTTSHDGLMFGIFDVTDALTNEGGRKGVYIPIGGAKYGPRFLITDDTTSFTPNSGTSGSSTIVLVESVYNTSGKISLAIPIAAMSSQCITTNVKIMQISPALYYGPVTMNGNNYFAVGLLLVPED